MSAPAVSAQTLPEVLHWDDRRGTGGMVLFILTEAMLFVALFFSYYWLGRDKPMWPIDEPPKLTLALVMLVVLLASSAVAEWARRQSKRGASARTRLGLVATVALGLGFIGLQVLEYRNHFETLTPWTDAYGSIFYTITSIHALHVMLGMLMLAYAAALPALEPTEKPPHRPVHNASLYWHFVDGVWVFIVTLLYVLPNLQR